MKKLAGVSISAQPRVPNGTTNRSSASSPRPAKFIIFNTKFLVCNASFLVFNARFTFVVRRVADEARWVAAQLDECSKLEQRRNTIEEVRGLDYHVDVGHTYHKADHKR